MRDASKYFADTLGELGDVEVASTGGGSDLMALDSAEPIDWDDDPPDPVPSVDDVALTNTTERFEAAFREAGWDAVAFYVPFHLGGAKRWGIYCVEDRFAELCEMAMTTLSIDEVVFGRRWVAWALRESLLAHELAHYRVELCATHGEMIADTKVLYSRFWGMRGRTASLLEVGELDEGIDTACEVQRAQDIDSDLAAFVEKLSVDGPPGYRDYIRYLDEPSNQSGCQTLIEFFIGDLRSGDLLAADLAEPYAASLPRFRLRRTSGSLPEWLLPRIVALPISRVISDALRRGATVGAVSRHPLAIKMPAGGLVPLKQNWSDQRVPTWVVKQLATLYQIPTAQYCEEVLARRKRGGPSAT